MNIHLPTEQELRQYMIEGSIIWWQKRKDNKWCFYYAVHKDVYRRVFLAEYGTRVMIRIFSRVLSTGERRRIREKELKIFCEAK